MDIAVFIFVWYNHGYTLSRLLPLDDCRSLFDAFQELLKKFILHGIPPPRSF
jgi:hypothetical protein